MPSFSKLPKGRCPFGETSRWPTHNTTQARRKLEPKGKMGLRPIWFVIKSQIRKFNEENVCSGDIQV